MSLEFLRQEAVNPVVIVKQLSKTTSCSLFSFTLQWEVFSGFCSLLDNFSAEFSCFIKKKSQRGMFFPFQMKMKFRLFSFFFLVLSVLLVSFAGAVGGRKESDYLLSLFFFLMFCFLKIFIYISLASLCTIPILLCLPEAFCGIEE